MQNRLWCGVVGEMRSSIIRAARWRERWGRVGCTSRHSGWMRLLVHATSLPWAPAASMPSGRPSGSMHLLPPHTQAVTAHTDDRAARRRHVSKKCRLRRRCEVTGAPGLCDACRDSGQRCGVQAGQSAACQIQQRLVSSHFAPPRLDPFVALPSASLLPHPKIQTSSPPTSNG